MHFLRPDWFWSLLTLPPLGLILALAARRRGRDWRRLGQWGRPPAAGGWFWLAALGLVVLALARPRWGRSDRPPLPPGHDVVLAVDVSRSMGAEDLPPDRLRAAVGLASGLVAALGGSPGDRVAVVEFAGRGRLRCPLTANLGAALAVLRSLRPGGYPPGGTDLAAGLDAALDAFDDQDHAEGRSVVLVSDGEDHAGHWRAAAERLRHRGVTVHAVAVGDAGQGHPIPLPSNSGPPGGTVDAGRASLRRGGEVVLSRRVDGPLAEVAKLTGGAFVPLGLTTTDLGSLYRGRIGPMSRARRRQAVTAAPGERFGLPLLAALVFVVAASWPGRRRPPPRGRRVRARVALGRAAVLLLLAAVVVGAGPPSAATERGPAGWIAEGRTAYASGRFDAALFAFRRAERLAPNAAVPPFDAAATLFQLGRFQDARDAYRRSRTRAGRGLRARIDFALGNTALALGEPAVAIRSYDSCLASAGRTNALAAVRRDAELNRAFAVAQAPRAPTAGGEGDPGGRPPGRRPEPKGDRGGPGPGAGPGQSPAPSPPTGRRGAGGAGGGGPAPPTGRAGESPEDQLEHALDDVRDARRRRIPDPPAADDPRGADKDW